MAKSVKPQVEKFREVARELGCDESEERFDEKLRAIAKKKPKSPEPPQRRERGSDS